MPQLTYTLPSEIEGSPKEVADAVLSQLAVITPAYSELIRQSAVQIRSSWMSFKLRHEPELTAEELAELWEGSRTREKFDALTAAAAAIREDAAALEKANKRS